MLQNHWKLTTIKFLFKDFVSSLNSSFVINTAQDDKHVEGGLKLEKTGQSFHCDVFQKCPFSFASWPIDP